MYPLTVLFGFLLAAPVDPTLWVTQSSSVAGTTESVTYTEYFEHKSLVLDGKLLVHVLVTQGKERLPAGWKPPSGSMFGQYSLEQLRANDLVPEVYETYLTNKSDAPITLLLLKLESPDTMFRVAPLSPREVSIAPGQWVKTDPIIEISTIYRLKPTIDFKLIYSAAGVERTLEGQIRRLTPAELPKSQ